MSVSRQVRTARFLTTSIGYRKLVTQMCLLQIIWKSCARLSKWLLTPTIDIIEAGELLDICCYWHLGIESIASSIDLSESLRAKHIG